MFIRLDDQVNKSPPGSGHTSSALESLYRNRNFRQHWGKGKLQHWTSAKLSKDSPTIDYQPSRPRLPCQIPVVPLLCRQFETSGTSTFVLSHTPASLSRLVSSAKHLLSPLLVINSQSRRRPYSGLLHHSSLALHKEAPLSHARTACDNPASSTESFHPFAARRCDHETSDIPKNIPAWPGLTHTGSSTSDLPRANAYTRSCLHH